MNELYRLTYISRNLVPIELRAQSLQDILDHSRKANHLAGITGILLSSRGYFCQLIEGLSQPLELLFEAIQLDPRHTDITVMEFVPVQSRIFTCWDMAHFDMEDPAGRDHTIETVLNRLKISGSSRNMIRVFADLITQREAFRN